MAKRKHWSQRTPREKLIVIIQDLRANVDRLDDLYTDHPELKVNIVDIIRISPNELLGIIDTFLVNEYRQTQEQD